MAELLGMFEQSVLLAVFHLGDGAYGRAILNQVQELLHRNASAGSVYATLERLEAEGLAHSRLAEGGTARGGRPRRYYVLTAEGRRALSATRSVLNSMWKNVRLPAQVVS